MRTLKVKSRYLNRDVVYNVGQVIEVDDDYAAWLMRDCPTCFEDIKPHGEAKAMIGPPADKMIKTSASKAPAVKQPLAAKKEVVKK